MVSATHFSAEFLKISRRHSGHFYGTLFKISKKFATQFPKFWESKIEQFRTHRWGKKSCTFYEITTKILYKFLSFFSQIQKIVRGSYLKKWMISNVRFWRHNITKSKLCMEQKTPKNFVKFSFALEMLLFFWNLVKKKILCHLEKNVSLIYFGACRCR